jgi:lysophospholipase L1-like esterase
MSGWLIKLTLLAGSSLTAFGLMEVIARIAYPLPVSITVPQTVDAEVGPIPIPLTHGAVVTSTASFTYSNNSQGLRGDHEYGAKTKPRILLLGDSFTYGLGVNDDQTFASLLQKSLPNYEVINGGNPDKGTDYALKFYETKGRRLQPDMVVLCFFANNDFIDTQRHWYYDDQANPIPLPINVTQPQTRPSPLRAWLIDHIRLVYIAKAVIVNVNRKLNPELTARYMTKLRDETAADGVRFLVVFIPDFHYLNGSKEQTAFNAITRSADIASIYPSFQRADYLQEGHFNSNGHQTIADALIPLCSLNLSRPLKHVTTSPPG